MLEKILKFDINIIFLFFIQFLYIILFYFWPDSYKFFNSEYTLVETLSALFYLLTFIFLLPINFKKERKNKFILFFTLLSLICFLEETDWLQNYINYSIEFIELKNSNDAVNIHNLEIFQGGSLLKSDFSILLMTKSQNLFRMFFTSFFIFLPFFYNLNYKFRNWLKRIGYVKINKNFLYCLILNLFINLLILFMIQNKTYEYEFSKSLAETRELMYSMYIFSYCLTLKMQNSIN